MSGKGILDQEYHVINIRNNYKGSVLSNVTLSGNARSKFTVPNGAFALIVPFIVPINVFSELEDMSGIGKDNFLCSEEEIFTSAQSAFGKRITENIYVPIPGYVIKTVVSDCCLYINVCGNFAIPDVVSKQGIQGCPYLVYYKTNTQFNNNLTLNGANESDVFVYNVVTHMKYVFCAIEDEKCVKKRVSLLFCA